MKKNLLILMTLTAAVLSAIAPASADDRAITRSKLPQQARNFLTTHYPRTAISNATIDREVFDTTYDVTLEDGTRLEFTRNGKCVEIRSPRNGSIPASVIPAKMAAYINKNYPGAEVRMMEVDGRECDVELSNGIEITFNHQLEMVRSNDWTKHRPDHRFTLRENF